MQKFQKFRFFHRVPDALWGDMMSYENVLGVCLNKFEASLDQESIQKKTNATYGGVCKIWQKLRNLRHIANLARVRCAQCKSWRAIDVFQSQVHHASISCKSD